MNLKVYEIQIFRLSHFPVHKSLCDLSDRK